MLFRGARWVRRGAPAGRPAAALLAVCLGLGPGAADQARASNFAVHPIQIALGGPTRSALVTVQNSSVEALRFQVRAYRWNQSPQGEILLAPTTEIIFFPRLLSLAPGEERKIRVGTTEPPGTVEKTYRLFVEELPPADPRAAEGDPGQVRVLARIGIPVFLAPPRGSAEPRLGALAVRSGRLAFEIRNAGTVHFAVQALQAEGQGPGGAVVWSRDLEGWYILAGGHRLYEVEIGPADCPRIRTVTLRARVGERTLTERLDLPASSCAP